MLEAIKQSVVPVLIDCSARGSNKKLQDQYGVEGVPTVLFLDSSGQQIGKIRNRSNIPGVREQIRNAGGGSSARPAGSGDSGDFGYYAYLAAVLLLGLGAHVLSVWSTVRFLDGFNAANSFGAALGWSILASVLSTPVLFLIGPSLGGLAIAFLALGVMLAYWFAVFFKHYQLSVAKSIAAIPLMIVIVAVLNIIGSIVLHVGGAQLWEGQVQAHNRRATEAILGIMSPETLEAVREQQPAGPSERPTERPRPAPTAPDLSSPAKPVEGLPGHYSYKDKSGKAHIVNDYDKVPAEYRY